jgi:hypothetical protein
MASCVRLGFVLAAALAVLGVCGVGPAGGAVFVCGSDTLRVDPVGGWEAVVLHLDGGAYLLPQAVAASGVRYSDGERTFWMKGENAFLDIDGVIVTNGCALVRRAERDPQDAAWLLDLPVFSSSAVDVSAFNERMRKASEAGEAWPRDPVRVAMEYTGGLDGPIAALVKVDDAGEGAASCAITVVCDGLLDDSIRGTWNELHLALTQTGAWEITRASRAYRCWRGPHGRAYSAEPCL